MTAIAIIRHYPTHWNGAQRLQGQTDVPLTDEARETLRGLRMPAPWNTARLIASPLSRAHETAQILAEGRAVTTDARLVEISWGEWEGQTAYKLLKDPASGFRPTHEWGPDTKAPGGESSREAWDRLRPALIDIATDPTPAVLVLHKALMRLILNRANDGSTEVPEVKRGRLYPMVLRPSGLPRELGEAVRLEPHP
ncbi:MAG: histidine phosphatase family protein [Pseudomonadota bacterium]